MKSKAAFKEISGDVVLWTLAIILAVFLASCSPSRKVNRIMTRYPADAATVCGRMFPPITSTKTVTEYLPGKTVYTPGPTVHVNCDSAVAAAEKAAAAGKERPRTDQVSADCPPQETRVDTVRVRDSIVVENTARVHELQNKNTALVAKAAAQQKALNITLWSLIALSIYTLIRWILRAWLRINIP